MEDGSYLKYNFYMPVTSREGILYEKLRGSGVISVVHFNIAKGYEKSRVCDTSKFILETFSEYLEVNGDFLAKLNSYFEGNIKTIPILRRTNSAEEETPF